MEGRTSSSRCGIRGLAAPSDLGPRRAVLAGVHPDFAAAQKKMTRLKAGVAYKPKAANRKVYNRLYTL